MGCILNGRKLNISLYEVQATRQTYYLLSPIHIGIEN